MTITKRLSIAPSNNNTRRVSAAPAADTTKRVPTVGQASLSCWGNTWGKVWGNTWGQIIDASPRTNITRRISS